MDVTTVKGIAASYFKTHFNEAEVPAIFVGDRWISLFRKIANSDQHNDYYDDSSCTALQASAHQMQLNYNLRFAKMRERWIF
jgi:hypothetical protein